LEGFEGRIDFAVVASHAEDAVGAAAQAFPPGWPTGHYTTGALESRNTEGKIAMLGLIGLVLMIAMTFMYFNELGLKFLAGAWAIILLAPFLLLVGISGWIVLIVQMAVIGGVYLKAKSS
jgi:hypothetical protein